MQQQTLPISELNLPALVRDYLGADDNVRPFIDAFPGEETLKQKMARKAFDPAIRATLAERLRQQYAGLGGEAVAGNLSALAEDHTLTLCTGHQLSLATGPLYAVYKICSLLALTRKLSAQYPERKFVPLFWMATEDHDFAEINHVRVKGKTFTWQSAQTGPAGLFSTAEVSLSDTIAQVCEALGKAEVAQSSAALLREAYAMPDLASATRYLLHQLFGRFGLLCLDANDEALKQHFLPQLKRELFERTTAGNVEKTNRELKHRGYAPQVNAREINLFYLMPGRRERITFIDQAFRVLNTDLTFSPEEMLAEVEQHPGRFSPNVLMRPLYQECILPNIAYIGGPAEVAYWLQCRSNFEGFGIDFPMVLLRDMALLLRPGQRKVLDNSGLPTSRLYTGKDQWIQWIARELASVDTRQERRRILEGFDKLATLFAAVDPTLQAAVNAEKQRTLHALENLEHKLLRSVKNKSETLLTKVAALHDVLFPNGELQERTDNFFEMNVYADGNLIDELIDCFDPMEGVNRLLTIGARAEK